MKKLGKMYCQSPPKFIVSACLAGINCTYNGGNKLKRSIKDMVRKGMAIAICPEVMGLLPTPRENSEIIGGDGRKVLNKKAKVLTVSGKDVTKYCINGARDVLSIAKEYCIRDAILKSKSPSCGVGKIYDGTFRKILKKGDGVLASLLRDNGIKLYTERSKIPA